MKTIINFFKRAARAYFRIAAQNYAWMYTGCVYRPFIENSEQRKES